MKKKFPFFAVLLCGSIFFFHSSNALANTCTEGNIAFYLKNGFTHEQIVRLCTKTPPTNTGSNNASNQPIPRKNNSSIENEKDQDYFQTVIDANSTTLGDNKLSFDRRECAVYGDLDMTHMRDKACVTTRTHITLKGLQILRTTKGIPLLKKQEFLVKGDITREYLSGTSRLNTYKMNAVKKQLPTRPTTLQIPIKTGIDPKVVSKRLKRLL